jgi:hypothetical protein|tara:strand:- start:524 stop:754 length:231 start_codon:yes stop_codon:yes gene_type:complete
MVSEKRGEIELLSKKESADRAWNQIYADMEKGAKVDDQRLAQIMDNCNQADLALLKRQREVEKMELKKKYMIQDRI